jgi:ABC-type sugar transport system substrate-binding protein
MSNHRNDAVRPLRSIRRTLTIGSIVLAAAVALVGCSAGSTSTTSSSSSSTGGPFVKASAALLAKGSSVVTGPSYPAVATSAIVPWKASLMPTPSSLPSKPLRVDVVFAIPVGYPPYVTHVIQTLGTKLGWTVKVFQASAPTQPAALSAMQAAVLDKPDAIVAAVVPGVWVGPALAQAKAAHIPTIDLHQDSTTGPGYTAWVPDAEGVQKDLLAAYIVSKSNGSAHVLLANSPGFSDANVPAAGTYLKGCAGCSTSTVQFNPTDYLDPATIQSDMTAKLASISKLDYVIWPNGSIPTTTVVAALSNSRTPNAKLLLNDASPESVGLVTKGSVPILVEMPAALTALIGMDDVSRLVQGQAPLAQDALRIPVSYWTQKTAPAANFGAMTAAQLAAADWLTPYETAWNQSLKSTLLGIKN